MSDTEDNPVNHFVIYVFKDKRSSEDNSVYLGNVNQCRKCVVECFIKYPAQ